MKPKQKKKQTPLQIELLSLIKLITGYRENINLPQTKKSKFLKNIDNILQINNDSIDGIILFVTENFKLLEMYKNDFIKLNIYENWFRCYLELSITLKRECTSFLSKLINIDTPILNVINEINTCLSRDISFYMDCINLDLLINNKKSEKCKLLDHVITSLNIVLNVTKNELKNKELTVDNIKTILDSIKINIVDNKFTESGIYNWNVILTKTRSYITNAKPFDIFNIRQMDTIDLIINEMLTLLNKDKCNNLKNLEKYNQIMVNYKNELLNIKKTDLYKKDINYQYNTNSILKRNINTCSIITNNTNIIQLQINRVLQDIELIKNCKDNIQQQFDILCNLNHFILNFYQKMISQNSDLNIKTLQTKENCFEYLKSFSFDIKWNDICLSIRNYLYFKNIKNLSSVGEYKSVKCSLLSIINNKEILETIAKHVKTSNEIITRVYMFIKLYTLNLYKNKKPIPNVTDFDFISMSVRAISINDARGSNMSASNKILLKELELFYETDFKPIYGEKCSAIGLSQILNFSKIEIVTAYKNNITMNYIKYLKNYVYAKIDEIQKEKYIELNKNDKREYKKEMKKQIAICINDILLGNVCGTYENMKCEEILKKWIIKNKSDIIPDNIDYSKKGLESDIEKNPIRYFEKMIFMNIELEKLERKMFCCFPLRNSLVPSNISIDNLSIITLFINPEKETGITQGISAVLKDNISIFYDKIWSEIVDLNKKQFKWNNKYKFDHNITTDGVNVNILFRHIDMNGLEIKSNKNKNKDFYKYVDKLGETDDGWDKELMKEEMKKMCEMYNLVLIDPGKNPDLLYMCNYNDNIEDIKYFKYTTKQRLHEMGTLKHKKILQNFKKERNISEIEKKLGEVSSKTCVIEKFKIYIKNKKEVDEQLKVHYEMAFIRKMQLRSHINKLRSESKLVNNIKSIFGKDKREIVLIYGDWSRLSQMRGVTSTPCIGLKRRLGENFKILNIDEFRTSCLDNITFKENKNAKVYNSKTGRTKSLHAVLVSKILKNTVGKSLLRFQNRNRNSSLNMRTIIEHYKKEGVRKLNFSRSYNPNPNKNLDSKEKLGHSFDHQKSGPNFENT